MDYAACNIIYVDRRAGENRYIKREAAPSESSNANSDGEGNYVDRNIRTLLGTFSEGKPQKIKNALYLEL
jgi:3',5'-cyclic-nucleotide phosphodiesterase